MPYTSRDETTILMQFAVQEEVAGGLDGTEHLYVFPSSSLTPDRLAELL